MRAAVGEAVGRHVDDAHHLRLVEPDRALDEVAREALSGCLRMPGVIRAGLAVTEGAGRHLHDGDGGWHRAPDLGRRLEARANVLLGNGSGSFAPPRGTSLGAPDYMNSGAGSAAVGPGMRSTWPG